MRTRRGLLAGIGASTALVAAGTLALLALSAVIAFNGWPTSPLSAHDTPVLVLQPASAGATEQRAAQPIVVAAPVVRRVTKRVASSGSTHRGAAVSASDRAAAKTIPGVAAAPVRRSAPAQHQVAKVTVPAVGHEAPPAPATVDTTVQAPAAPAPVTVPTTTTPAPPPVTTTTPSPPTVVQQVTGTVNQTVSGATGAVGGLLGGK